MKRKILIFGLCLSFLQLISGQSNSIQNLSLSGVGGEMKSWEKNVHVVPGHEPYRANDGTTHTFWTLNAEDMPGDIGVEWANPHQLSALIIRYFDGRSVRGPITSRTQEGSRLQVWLNGAWKDIKSTITGSETNVVRYVFDPVTTSRIRLLFTEFSDPTAMRFPDPQGIHICEFEAYEKPPFQIFSTEQITWHQAYGSYLNRSNESAWDDGGFEIGGPLIVEQKQTKVFTDTLRPNLIVTKSDWALNPCAASKKANILTIENGFLKLSLSTLNNKIKETELRNLVTGESVALLGGNTFRITIDGKALQSDSFTVKNITASINKEKTICNLAIDLNYTSLNIVLNYELAHDNHFYHKWLSIQNTAVPVILYDATLSDLDLPNTVDLMAGHELSYPVSRLSKGGFFSCLETMYWDHVGNALTYYPGVSIHSTGKYETEKAVVGVYRNTGEVIGNWDIGVKDWVIEYHDHVSPIKTEWPDFYCEGWAANLGPNELAKFPEQTKKRVEIAGKMGVRYMDSFEPLHEVLTFPEAKIQNWLDLCKQNNIGTGFWIDWGSDTDWSDWSVGKDLGQAKHIMKPLRNKLSVDAETYYSLIKESTKKYGLTAFHWGDFLQVFPVSDSLHPYLSGKQSIYQQGQRVLKTKDEIRSVSPEVMLGADGGMTNPQWVRHVDSRCFGVITDNPYEYDHHPALLQDIHLDRLYSDMNRGYNYRLHYTYLRPWFRQLNTLNHYGHDKTMQHDKAGFRFSLLSALGLAGQLVIHDVPVNVPESEIQFTKYWVDWSIKNKEFLKQNARLFDRTYQVTDVWSTDPDALVGLTHLINDRGFVFLINRGATEQEADLVLALKNNQNFVIKEVYPSTNYLKSNSGYEYKNAEHVQLTVQAKQVRIVLIEPASKAILNNIQVEKEISKVNYDRYIGNWTKENETPYDVSLKSEFSFPANSEKYLAANLTVDSTEIRDPWAYDKAYLVILMQDEAFNSFENWIPDNLVVRNDKGAEEAVFVTINNVKRTLVPFKTARNQRPNLTRCYYLPLMRQECNATKSNRISITLPKKNGLVFSGAYIDLPDQMPDLPNRN